MAQYTQTYTFTNGTTADGGQVNTEIVALGTSVNNITNAQIDSSAAIAISKTTLGTYTAPTSWSVTWTQSGGSPAIGNGTLTGRYMQIGKRVFCDLYLLGGSTTNWGTGGAAWRFSLPVTAATLTNYVNMSSGGRYNDADGARNYEPVLAEIVSTTTFGIAAPFATGGSNYTNAQPFTNSAPVAGGTGDQLWVSFSYEAA